MKYYEALLNNARKLAEDIYFIINQTEAFVEAAKGKIEKRSLIAAHKELVIAKKHLDNALYYYNGIYGTREEIKMQELRASRQGMQSGR